MLLVQYEGKCSETDKQQFKMVNMKQICPLRAQFPHIFFVKLYILSCLYSSQEAILLIFLVFNPLVDEQSCLICQLAYELKNIVTTTQKQEFVAISRKLISFKMLPYLLLFYCYEIVQFGLQFMDFIHLLRVVILQFFILLLFELLQTLKFSIQLVVPRVQHHRLEPKSTCAHDETCYRKVSREKSHNQIIFIPKPLQFIKFSRCFAKVRVRINCFRQNLAKSINKIFEQNISRDVQEHFRALLNRQGQLIATIPKFSCKMQWTQLYWMVLLLVILVVFEQFQAKNISSKISNNFVRKKVLDLELNQMVNPVANDVDGIQSLDFKLIKLLILALKLSDLFELMVELLMVRVQHSGLEGQCRTSNSKDAHGQNLFHDKHFSTVVINSKIQLQSEIQKQYYKY